MSLGSHSLRVEDKKVKFGPWLPFMALDGARDEVDERTSAVLRYNNDQLNALLNESTDSDCMRYCMNDKSLKSLLNSYVRHRERPGFSPRATSSAHQSLLEELDKCFFLLALKLSFLVVGEKVTNPRNAEQVAKCSLLSLPTLASLFSLAGDSNRTLATKLMENLNKVKDTVKELSSMISDVDRVFGDIMQACSALDTRARLPPKAGRKVKASAVATEEVADLTRFCQDVVACVRSLLLALPLQSLSGGQLSVLAAGGVGLTPTGTALLGILSGMYDRALPRLEGTLPDENRDEAWRGVRYALAHARRGLEEALTRLLQASCEDANRVPCSDKQKEEVVGWLEALQGLLQAPQEVYQPRAGAAPSPSLVVALLGAGGSVRESAQSLLKALDEDEGAVQYLFDSVQAMYSQGREEEAKSATGVTSMHDVVATAMLSPTTLSSHTETDAAERQEEDDRERTLRLECISSLQALFPDHGDGFCYACLDAFEWDVERTVDALLTGNLPPAIAHMNRAMRSKLDVVTTRLKKEATRNGQASQLTQKKREEEKTQAREAEKARLRAAQDRQMEDQRLLRRLAAEYADDYDDQWDDAPSAMPFAQKQQAAVVIGDAEAGGVFRPRGSGRGGNRGRKAERLQQQEALWAQWDKEREDVLRVNTLIKEKEEERAFWDGMSLARSEANRQRGERVKKGSDEVEVEQEREEAPPLVSSEAPRQPRAKAVLNPGGKQAGDANPRGKQAGDTTSRAEGPSAGTKKPKTKTFDKHRQKSRALKKGDVYQG